MAELVTDVGEIIDLVGDLGFDAAPRRSAPPRAEDLLTPGDDLVLASVPLRRGTAAESVAVAAGVPVAATVAALGRLELGGHVERDAAGWRRAQRPRAP